jgi:hypothetical protein
MKRYKFQAMVTAGPPAESKLASMRPGQTRRMTVGASHHEDHSTKFFAALVTNNADNPEVPGDRHFVATIVLTGDDALDYVAVGDPLTLWLTGDVGRAVITRRLFI